MIIMYRICTKFETIYTHEQHVSVVGTETLEDARDFFIRTITNPEVKLCVIDKVQRVDDEACTKIIASYKPI